MNCEFCGEPSIYTGGQSHNSDPFTLCKKHYDAFISQGYIEESSLVQYSDSIISNLFIHLTKERDLLRAAVAQGDYSAALYQVAVIATFARMIADTIQPQQEPIA